MQTCYRAAAARDHLRRQKEGAAGFQRIYQGFLGRTRAKARRAEIAAQEQADLEDSAVTVLQRWWRGAEAEMEIEARRIEREMAGEEFAEAAAEHLVQHERLRPNRAKEREADAKAALEANKVATALLKRKRNRATQRKIRAGQRAAKAEQKRLRDELRAINADASSSDSDYIDEESSAEYVLGWNMYIDGNHVARSCISMATMLLVHVYRGQPCCSFMYIEGNHVARSRVLVELLSIVMDL